MCAMFDHVAMPHRIASQERLTAKEAMEHPYFLPVREAAQAQGSMSVSLPGHAADSSI